MAHEERSEAFYLLAPEHRGMIKIEGVQHLEELEKLAVGFSLSSNMYEAAHDCVASAVFYGLDLTPYKQVRDLADIEFSRIRARFEADYC
jgi:hypothetical protein